jgi:hypothetical protein
VDAVDAMNVVDAVDVVGINIIRPSMLQAVEVAALGVVHATDSVLVVLREATCNRHSGCGVCGGSSGGSRRSWDRNLMYNVQLSNRVGCRSNLSREKYSNGKVGCKKMRIVQHIRVL